MNLSTNILDATEQGAAEETYSTCLMQLPSNWTQCVDSISQITPVSLTAMVSHIKPKYYFHKK